MKKKSNEKIKIFLLICLLIIIFSLFFSIKFVGFIINTPSSVTILGNQTSPPAQQIPSGGGGGAVLIRNFSVDKDLIKIIIKQGETRRETLEIKNIGDKDLDVEINTSEINKFVVASDKSFKLDSKENKIINLDFFARYNELPDAYTGRIYVTAGGKTKIVNVIIEVKEKKPLFDIKTEILNKIVNKGEKIKANLSITNFGDLRNIDLLLYIAIKDFDNNIITFKDESLTIDKELSLVKELKVLEDVLEGQYIFYSRVSYGNISASSADVFEIKTEEKLSLKVLIIIVIIISILIISFMVYFFIKARKKIKKKKKEK